MNTEKCPQCSAEINKSTNRLVQDTCGHKKCRQCLMRDETDCKMCVEIIQAEQDQAPTVIKYDDSCRKTHDIKTEDSEHCDTSTDDAKTEIKQEKHKVVKKKYKPSSLPNHITIVSKSPLKYKCSVCMKLFSTNTSVKYHIYCAGLEKPLKCSECDKRFVSRSHMEAHVRSHSGIRPFTCTICHKAFVQKSKLNRHMKLHTGERPFVCSECGKSFNKKDALKVHHRTHTGDKPFSCKQCGAQFSNKSNLTQHQITHTKEKPFMCEDCGKKFGVKWALIFHKRTHNRDKPYTCQKCTKVFTNLKDLKRHDVIHLDAKPYQCTLCKTRFRRKDNLTRHLKNTHSTNPVEPVEDLPKTIKPAKTVKQPKVPKSKSSNTPVTCNEYKEKPNAINVIKSNHSELKNAVPVINGPFKLAFKTDAFKNNYNIFNRDYTEPPPRIQTMKPYDMKESLNICQRILTPMNSKADNAAEVNPPVLNEKPKNVIMSVGKVNEKDSLEICKKILSPPDAPPIHYGTSFEHKKHAFIKNIKFKLPSTYTSNAIKNNENDEDAGDKIDMNDILPMNKAIKINDVPVNNDDGTYKEYEELTLVKMGLNKIVNQDGGDHYQQSVIVNPHLTDSVHPLERHFESSDTLDKMHWRRRTSESLQPKINHL